MTVFYNIKACIYEEVLQDTKKGRRTSKSVFIAVKAAERRKSKLCKQP